MVYEHQKEIHELRQEMREKDSLLDDLTQNSEVQLQVGQFDENLVIFACLLFRNVHVHRCIGSADATATLPSVASLKSRMVFLSHAGLPRLSRKRGC